MALEFEGADAASILLISDHLEDITPTLSGATFVPAKLFETDVLVAELASPADGQLQIANAGPDTASVAVFVGVPVGRALEVSTSETLIDPNSPADITISLSEAGNNEVVAAEVTAPSGAVMTVSLTETAAGSWTGSVTPTESGVHTVGAWVEGNRPRFDSTLFTVSSGVAQLTGAFTERLEGAEDGLADTLVIAPEVTASAAGRYRLAADLADSSGTVIASAGAVADLAVGTSNVDVGFSGRAIYEAGVNGPYEVVNVALSRDDAGLTLEDHVDELGSTAAYPFSEFDHFPILFDLDSFTDAGTDANSDEVFESLNVAFSVSVETAGTYAVNARLLAPDGTEIAETQSTPTLVAGSNEVDLVFDGEAIAASGLDGPYEVADLSVYPLANADVLGYLVSAHVTAPYEAADFDARDVFYLHNNPTPPSGDTNAQADLPLTTTEPTATALPNYAVDLDGNTGVTGRFIDISSTGLEELDLQKFQSWLTDPVGSDLALNGDAQLSIWAKMKAPNKNIQLRAFLSECDGGSSCTHFATGEMEVLVGASDIAYQELTVSFDSIAATIDEGNHLLLRVVAVDVADADQAYLAYDTVDYPAQLVLGE